MCVNILIQSCHSLQEVGLLKQEMTRFLLLLAHNMARQRGVFHCMHKQKESVGNVVLYYKEYSKYCILGSFVRFLLKWLIWPYVAVRQITVFWYILKYAYFKNTD